MNAGTILVRQRGTKHQAGVNVGQGKDDTLFALVTGIVSLRIRAGTGALSAFIRRSKLRRPRSRELSSRFTEAVRRVPSRLFVVPVSRDRNLHLGRLHYI